LGTITMNKMCERCGGYGYLFQVSREMGELVGVDVGTEPPIMSEPVNVERISCPNCCGAGKLSVSSFPQIEKRQNQVDSLHKEFIDFYEVYVTRRIISKLRFDYAIKSIMRDMRKYGISDDEVFYHDPAQPMMTVSANDPKPDLLGAKLPPMPIDPDLWQPFLPDKVAEEFENTASHMRKFILDQFKLDIKPKEKIKKKVKAVKGIIQNKIKQYGKIRIVKDNG